MKKFTQPVFNFHESVTDEHLQFFRKHGVLQFKNFITRERVADLLAEVKSVETFLLKNGIKKINGIPLKFGTDTDGSTIIQRLAFTSGFSDGLSEFLQSERLQSLTRLLAPYEGRIGENEKDGLVVNHYINTTESNYTQLGWHTDCPRDLFLGSRILPMLNVGLHLDDCPMSLGGLRVLPGTHNKGLLTLFFKKKYFIDNKPDANETGLDIEAGDLTIHDGRLWHRVQQSPLIGEQSRRRVMYIPIITGAYKPKNANSATPLYHRIGQLIMNPSGSKSKRKELQHEKTRSLIPELNP
jgi:phytanoyl-CoA hydroxylase